MPNRPFPGHKTDLRFRELWVELRTASERIEGVVRVPASSRCRRIGDIIRQADRDDSGVLHLARAVVFDSRTNSVKFERRNLGVSRRSVIFASPLETPNESKLPWSLPPKEVLNN